MSDLDPNKPNLTDAELARLLERQPGESEADRRQRVGSVRDVADENGRPLPSEPSLFEQARDRGLLK